MGQPQLNEIEITAKRIENVPGTHVINYASEVDSIEIKHTAHNRSGFALGAVVAAEWIKDKKGVFSMKDVLNIG
jgi:4-hydroxy-tetrahydrodipicolinate reductase